MTAQVFRNSRRDTLMSSSVSVTADTALSGADRQAGAWPLFIRANGFHAPRRSCPARTSAKSSSALTRPLIGSGTSLALETCPWNFVNEKFAMKHRIVPLARVGNVLVVAMDDPTQTRIIDDLQRSTGLKIEMITSNSAQITRALERLYRVDVTPSLDSGTTVDVIGEDADADMYGGAGAHPQDQADEDLLQVPARAG